MRRYEMKVLCPGCEGRGFVDPPYPESTVQAVTCPCCAGAGAQVVAVEEE